MVQEFKKKRLETPFKGNNVTALIKTSNCEKLVIFSSRKFRQLLCFFGFQWPNNRLKMFLASPNDQKYIRYPIVLKYNVILTRALRSVIRYFFKWKFLSDVRRFYLHDSKWNSRSDVDGLTHTKQLLNLVCIVYKKDWCWSAYIIVVLGVTLKTQLHTCVLKLVQNQVKISNVEIRFFQQKGLLMNIRIQREIIFPLRKVRFMKMDASN